ncbi:MAG: PASTA domain-containing protein [Spirochaetaceae bacterium]|jgi:beta-lactam-binding protein with PASTA domain|nr:PASTA domain-containing protein [Spirochaetaceae bacterium]
MEKRYYDNYPPANGQKNEVFQKPWLFFCLCAVFLLFVAVIATAAFFISVRGAEEVMVPDVQGKDIIPALLELQSKELDARVQLRYSSLARGAVIEQDPRSGTIVKAGRKIRIVLSQGALLSNIGSYIGRPLEDVRGEFRTMFGVSEAPLLVIKEPVMYQYSTEPVDTILEQDPLPGTPVSGPAELRFIVSKGAEALNINMPSLLGMEIDEAVRILGKAGIRWIFTVRPPLAGEEPMTITAQDPAGTYSIPANRPASLVAAGYRPQDIPQNESAGLFSYRMPENPFPMQTDLDIIFPAGDRKKLVSVEHFGGEFTYPYRVPRGSTLVLSLLGKEKYRETIQ